MRININTGIFKLAICTRIIPFHEINTKTYIIDHIHTIALRSISPWTSVTAICQFQLPSAGVHGADVEPFVLHTVFD